MQTDRSFSTITHLLSVLKRDDCGKEKNSSLSEQIMTHFVPAVSLFGKAGVVEKSSLHGKVSCFIHQNASKSALNRKVREVFAKALADLIRTPQRFEKIRIADRICLVREFESEEAIKTLVGGSEEAHKSTGTEIEALEDEALKKREEAETAEIEEIKKWSFLQFPTGNEPILELARFQELLKESVLTSTFYNERLEQFLIRYPTYAAADWKEKRKKIQEGLAFRDSLFALVTEEGEVKPESARMKVLRKASKTLRDEVLQLSPDASRFFCGSSGQRNISLQKLLGALSHLPQEIKDQMPEALRNVAAKLTKKPQDLVDETVHEWIEKIKEQAQSQNDQGQLDFLNGLFPDESRQLSTALGDLLPNSLGKGIEARLQKGALGNLADFLGEMLPDENRKLPEAIRRWLPHVIQHGIENKMQGGLLEILAGLVKFSPSPQMSDFLSVVLLNKDLIENSQTSAALHFVGKLLWMWSFLPSETSVKTLKWLAENAHLLRDVKSLQEVQERIELEIHNWSKTPVKSIQKNANAMVSSAIDQVRSHLKPEWLDFLGLDGSFAFGQLWLNFTRQPSGRFTVEIYSTGIALTKHLQNPEGKISFPIRLVDIDPLKLNRDFFFKLLFHTIEPNCNEETRSSGADLFEFITEYLQGKEDLHRAPIFRKLPLSISSERELSELCLTAENATQGYAHFVILLEALTDFCSPYLTGKHGTLEIFEPAIADALEAAIVTLRKCQEHLTSSLPSDFSKKFEVTAKEIHRAIQQFKIRKAAEEAREKEINAHKASHPFTLPDNILEPIRTVFLKNHIFEETILAYKPALLWAFGEELEDFVDALGSMLGPAPKSIEPAKNSLLEEFKGAFKKGWLKGLIQGICLQSALSVLKFAISVARVYQSGFPPIFILSSVDWAAHQVLPKVILDWYHQALGYLLRKSIAMTLNFALRLMLNPDQMSQFLLFHNNWRTALKNFTKDLMGAREISYSLARPLEQHPSLGYLAIAVSPQDVEQDATKIEVQSGNLDLILPHISISRAQLSQNPSEMRLEVSKWIESSRQLEERSLVEALNYLCKQVECLPLPTSDNENFWQSTMFKEESLELLRELSERIVDSARKCNNLLLLRQELFGETLVSLYSILSIVDFLVRQEPLSCVSGYATNIHELLTWCNSPTSFLARAATQARLKHILVYFGINPTYLPSIEESLKINRQALFHYDSDFVGDSVPLRTSVPAEVVILREFLPQIDFERQACNSFFTEAKFLEIIADPFSHAKEWKSVVEEIWTRGLKSNPKFIYPKYAEKKFRSQTSTDEGLPRPIIFKKLLDVFRRKEWRRSYPKLAQLLDGMFITNKMSNNQKLEILFSQPLKLHGGSQNTLFPKNFSVLRFHAVQCSLFTKSLRGTGGVLDLKLARYSRIVYFCPVEGLGINKALGFWPEKCQQPVSYQLRSYYNPLGFLNADSELYLSNLAVRSQSEIVESNADIKLSRAQNPAKIPGFVAKHDYYQDLAVKGMYDWQTIEAILCEPKDACMRLLSYFAEHKDSLVNNPRLFEFFERIMFRPFALTEQVSQSPLVVAAIGEFLSSQFSYHQAQGNLLTSFWLVTVAISLRDYCAGLGLDTKSHFPSIRLELEKLHTKTTQPAARMYYRIAKALIPEQSLTLLAPDDQLELALDLVFPLFCGSFFLRRREFFDFLNLKIPSHQRFFESLVEAYQIRYWQEYNDLKTLLKDSVFANTLIRKLLKELNIAIEEAQDLWRPAGDLIFSNQGASINFKTGSVRGVKRFVSFNFVDAVKKWGKDVLRLPESNSLIHTPDGHFTSSDGSITVEVADFFRKDTEEIIFSGNRYSLEHEPPKFPFSTVYPEDQVWKTTSSESPKGQFFGLYRAEKLVAYITVSEKVDRDSIMPKIWEMEDFAKVLPDLEKLSSSYVIDLKATKQLEGVSYRFTPQESLLLTPEFLNSLGSAPVKASDMVIWLEETTAPRRKVHISSHGITRELSQPQVGILRFLNPEESSIYHQVQGKEQACVAASLERFCPRSSIQLFCRSGSTRVEKLHFTPFNLSFDVVCENDVLKAVNPQEFPGFHIAPVQYHRELNSFGSYLLLENAESRRKVLLPEGQWISTLALRALPMLGPFANLLVAKIDERNIEAKGKYYTFDMDEKGCLSTEDPQALIFLIALSLAANRSKDAERLCRSFELIAKRTPLSSKLIDSLLPILLVPVDINGIIAIRRRLIAALEENLALNASLRSEPYQSQRLSSVVSCAVVLYDLTQTSLNVEKLSAQDDFQDWLLFQYVFRLLTAEIRRLTSASLAFDEEESKTPSEEGLRKTLASFTNLAAIPLEILKNLADRFSLEMVIETLILPAQLDKRFEYLKRRFGKKDGVIKAAVKLAFDILKTPAGLPSVGLHLQQIIPQVEGMGSQQENQVLKTGTFLKDVGALYFNRFNRLDLEALFYATQEAKDVALQEKDFDIKRLSAGLFKRNFVSYYKIASHSRYNSQTAKLKQLLPLIRGGWDAQTAVLVKYLEYIIDPKYFLMFARVDVLLAAFHPDPSAAADAPFAVRYPKWISFFTRLNKIVMAIEATLKGVDLILPRLLDHKLQMGILNQVTGGRSSYNYTIQMPLLSLGVSTFRTLKSCYDERLKLSSVLKIAPPSAVVTSAFSALQEDDLKFDVFFRHKLFPLAFEFGPPIQAVTDEAMVAPFDIAQGGDVAERVNLSLRDYYDSNNRIPRQIRLKNEEALWSLYVILLEYSNGLKKALKLERERLMDLVNLGNSHTPVTFEELTRCFLSGNFDLFAKRLHLSPVLVSQLDLAVARDIARHLRLQQFERILAHFEVIVSSNKTSLDDCEEQLEAIAEELFTERAYKFDQQSSRLTRQFMLFEYVTKKMLWDKQVKIITQLLLGKEANVAFELLMSLGKTWYGIPTENAFEADGTKIVFDIFPSAIAATNIRQIGRQAREIFDQTVNVLRFTRRQGLVKANLDTVALVLQRSMQQREVISMTREDIQALELMYLDLLHRIRHTKTLRTYQSKCTAVETVKILQSIRRFGKLIGDEAHELLNHRQELNYPAGPHSTIRHSYYMVMEMCMRHLMQIPSARQLLAENNLSKLLASESEWLEIVHQLAVKMSLYKPFAFATPQAKDEFVDYVCGQTPTIPASLKAHPLFSEIALVKGTLCTLLPLTFSRKVNVDFGASLAGNGEYARPYEGNTSPMEQASIRSPYEALTKTFVQFLHNGLSTNQFDRLVKTMLNKMHQEIKVRKVCAEDTVAYRLFNSWSKEVSLVAMESCEAGSASLDPAILHSKEAILLYIRYHVQKDIKYWKCNLRSGPQDFFSMFASGFLDTGTPYNFGTYPSKLKMQWDAGTIGRALDTIHKKCPNDGIHVLQSSQPYDILNEVLGRFFKQGSDFTALIDGSALLTGLANHEVAQVMRTFVHSFRPDIKGIVYFHKNVDGQDELVCLEQSAEKPIPLDRSTLSPEQRLSYFDQRHGFAADIPQKNNGIGLNLVGNSLTLNRLMQEVFRMRGIKRYRKMYTSDATQVMNSPELGTQTIQFAMTAEMKTMLSPERAPTLRDIVHFAICNEAKVAAQDNYESYRQKLISLVRRAVMDKLEALDSADEMIELFKEFEDVLVQNVQDDPAHLFGYIEMEIDTLGENGVLAKLRAEVYAKVFRSTSFSLSEKEAIKQEIEEIEIHAMPPKVKMPTDGGTLVLHVADDLNKAVYHETEVETETAKEQENNRENELQNSVQNATGGSTFYEWSWEGQFNPHDTSWLTFSPPKPRSSKVISKHVACGFNLVKRMVGIGEENPVLPPFFKVNELLKDSKLKVMAQVSDCFDSRIWFSNNFLPRHISALAEQPVEIGGVTQRDLYEVIVHCKENPRGGMEFLAVGCLSIKDSVELRKRFNNAAPSSRTKAFIYDINLRVIVAGHQVELETLRNDPDFILLESQLKFLNGDVVYHRDQLKSLKKWMRRFGADKLKDTFHHIHCNRGRSEFYGSDIEQMILAAQNVPKEERF